VDSQCSSPGEDQLTQPKNSSKSPAYKPSFLFIKILFFFTYNSHFESIDTKKFHQTIYKNTKTAQNSKESRVGGQRLSQLLARHCSLRHTPIPSLKFRQLLVGKLPLFHLVTCLQPCIEHCLGLLHVNQKP
jgi:hypothetical protein